MVSKLIFITVSLLQHSAPSILPYGTHVSLSCVQFASTEGGVYLVFSNDHLFFTLMYLYQEDKT